MTSEFTNLFLKHARRLRRDTMAGGIGTKMTFQDKGKGRAHLKVLSNQPLLLPLSDRHPFLRSTQLFKRTQSHSLGRSC